MFRELLGEVRVQGTVDLSREPSLRDVLPIVYNGEASSDSQNPTPYYNSGGRSILFERGGLAYRIKGVDPFGKLTERVAKSSRNRTQDVTLAYLLLRESRHSRRVMFNDEKPFGLFFFPQAELEMQAFSLLDCAYSYLGIENPCKPLIYADTGVEVKGQKTYQTAFQLPRIEADFRMQEFTHLLTERLDECTPEEIASKTRNLNRLYGRFIYWAGVNAGILSNLGLVPVNTSFCDQNWVISRHKGGYGLFRVDHTSTKRVSQEQALQELVFKDENGVPYIANNFSVFPGRVQMAGDPKRFPRKKKDMKFSDFTSSDLSPVKVGVDESALLAVHNKMFMWGVESSLVGKVFEPIPEEMFLEALA